MARKKTYIYTAWCKPYSVWSCCMYIRTARAAYDWFCLALQVGHFNAENIRIYRIPFDEFDTANPFGSTKDLTAIFFNRFAHENEFRNSEEDPHRD